MGETTMSELSTDGWTGILRSELNELRSTVSTLTAERDALRRKLETVANELEGICARYIRWYLHGNSVDAPAEFADAISSVMNTFGMVSAYRKEK
jgi:hypothetical protein